MQDANYFLYIVGTRNDERQLNPGDCGVGKTSMGAGIFDAPYGTMYIVSAIDMYNAIGIRNSDPDLIKHYILKFYGIPQTL